MEKNRYGHRRSWSVYQLGKRDSKGSLNIVPTNHKRGLKERAIGEGVIQILSWGCIGNVQKLNQRGNELDMEGKEKVKS